MPNVDKVNESVTNKSTARDAQVTQENLMSHSDLNQDTQENLMSNSDLNISPARDNVMPHSDLNQYLVAPKASIWLLCLSGEKSNC